jgi:hopene-associated glycosyltransferase HpnB
LIPATIATGFLTLAIWVYLTFFRGMFWRIADDSVPLGPTPPRRLAAVIPARDEAGCIAAAVRSLLAQQWTGDLRIFVVDDHSTDGTAEIARVAGAVVIPSQPLPPGWTGKLWAVSQGVARALDDRPDYLLLTDADIEHAPDSVAALVSRAEAWGLDLASFMVRLRVANFSERLLIPAFVFFFLKLYPPRWIARPDSRTAGAAGGCILIRPAALERAGGIQGIRAELIDDCALARAVKRGGRTWMGLTSATRSIRPYSNAGEIRSMISRTAFTQLRHSWLLLAGTVAGMALTYLAPPLLLFFTHGPARVLGAAAWLLMVVTYVPTLRLYRRSPLWALLLPAVAAFYSAATVESAVRYVAGRGGVWKGRVQDVRT